MLLLWVSMLSDEETIVRFDEVDSREMLQNLKTLLLKPTETETIYTEVACFHM